MALLQFKLGFTLGFLIFLIFFRILVVNNLVCPVILSPVQFLGLKT
jgi:hypothetical protein